MFLFPILSIFHHIIFSHQSLPTNYVIILSNGMREPHFTLQVKLANRLFIVYIYLLLFALDLSPL